ncbi:MAG: hypothetical protein EOM52_04670 [Clostridia bacterium]|nr:hypothetical protein [Clostridia bacterium]
MDGVQQKKKQIWLDALASAYRPENGMESPASAERQAFDPATREGTEFYESLSDEDLLTALCQAAARLGHSPSQKEVFWVYRTYLRQRFGKWPTALRLAGLSRAAGAGGCSLSAMSADYDRKEAMLAQVRSKAGQLGRVPHATDLPQVCEGLKREYATWGEVLAAAGVKRSQTVSRIAGLTAPDREMLAKLRAQAEELNRAPLKSEADAEVRAALIARCGSWRNALYQVGLEPVIHITPFSGSRLDRSADAPVPRHKSALYDCYYRVLTLDEEARAYLEAVSALAQRLGRAPKRGEVAPEVRHHLQASCGSWSNALFQLGLQPNKSEP